MLTYITDLRKLLSEQNWRVIIITTILVIFVDQITKQYFFHNYQMLESKDVIGDFFKFTLHTNQGIAFGIRLFQNQAIFVAFTFVAIIFIFFYLIQMNIQHKYYKYVIGLIIGGAIGNFIERALFGEVIDFFDVDFFDINISAFQFLGINFDGFYMTRWPIFNIADSAISIGMVGIFILSARETKKQNA